MVVAYDGTNYSGWQIQPNGVTIEQKLNEALQALLGKTSAWPAQAARTRGYILWETSVFLIRIPVCRRRRSATH